MKKKMLLAEGFKLCFSSWRGWLGLAIFWFAGWLVFGALSIIGLKNIFQMMAPMFAKGHPPLPPAQLIMLILPLYGKFLLWALACAIVSSAQHYMFLVFFARQTDRTLHGSVGGYFYVYWKAFQVWLMLVGIGLAAGLVGGLGGALLHLGIISIIVMPIAFIAGLYLSIRYKLVLPLAVAQSKPALKNSRELVSGNWWRVLGNTLLFYILIFGVSYIVNFVFTFIIGFILGLIGAKLGAGPFQFILGAVLVGAFVFAFNSVVFSVARSAYETACMRVLREEKQTA